MFGDGVSSVGFQTTETEIATGSVGHGAGESEAVGVALFSAARQCWPAGITQIKQFGCLVEGLTCGIIYRFAKQAINAKPAHLNELGVAARYQQCGEWHAWWCCLRKFWITQ